MSAILRQVGSLGWYRVLVVFFVIWLVLLFFTALPLINVHSGSNDPKLADRLSKALSDLESLRKQNNELQELFKEISLG